MHRKTTDTTDAVDAYMAALDHPCKAEVEALRRIITGVDARIAEGVKWNAPSWRLDEYFATTHLRAKQGIGVILHLGAKTRAPERKPAIDDPDGLLEWLGPDRARVVFADMADLRRRQAAFEAVLRQWIRLL
ncbi:MULTISPECIES: DUF1801 domain-containing protein [unclassified Pseudoxanthomonas]|uniref:DUF1801 domain-containing protein n=1 Tax=unclassified Pseudoxanthomonas TaxID=2645906 RepID=UPI00161C68D1|nr:MULTISPECIES: DUF1801 domain-containing protein [unclassified Pseudoxanthomonas]MBB3276261.1 hypothetical protein [Pseudoxanthomonas sp. OG2]MBV7472661.1 DUF1801 domain-containing protein [Pseudoxanthomonas sp. PXM05]UBB25120.1 DUF1801 domain-containing protein [Pseudoxanthomonas japonensis]